MTIFTLSGGELDEADAAAAIAAITCLLEEEAALAADAALEGKPEGWRDAARLMAQGLVPARVPAAPRWSSIERLRRAGRGGGGIVGQ